jgi:hypothetical protein
MLILSVTCTEPTGPNDKRITLSVDVSCTEAWLTISASNVSFPQQLEVTRDGRSVFNVTLTTSETTLYDSTLTPNKSYTYQAILSSKQDQIPSNKVTVTTLDTTSHNFIWQTFTFGDGGAGSSVLYDVTIINENDIWAVGEIYANDSLAYYNAVHWNGKEWNKIRLTFNNSYGQTFIVSYKTILAFNNHDLWFAADQLIHWDGNTFRSIEIPTDIFHSWINRISGNSTTDFNIVGNSGNSAHYNGNTWNKIESGTTMDLYDIYSNNGKDIYVSGGNFSTSDGILLKGNANGFQTLKEGKNNTGQLFKPYFAGIAKTVWVSNTNTVYFGGNLLYRYKDGKYDLVRSLPGNYLNGNTNGQYWGFISQVRGNGDNDIIMAGEGNTMRHFNGATWQQLGMPYSYNSEYTWLSVSMKDNLIVSVGRTNTQGVIMILKRK